MTTNKVNIPVVTDRTVNTVRNEITRRIHDAGLVTLNYHWFNYLRGNVLRHQFLTTIVESIEPNTPFSFEEIFAQGYLPTNAINCMITNGFLVRGELEQTFVHVRENLYRKEVRQTYYCKVTPETLGLMIGYVNYRINERYGARSC